MKKWINYISAIGFGVLSGCSCGIEEAPKLVRIYPDSVVNDLSGKPVGLNLNFLMDGNRFPSPAHSLKDALKEMGMNYLRYPGGEKSDLYLFSLPPYEEARPALARTAGLEDYPGMFTASHEFKWDPLGFDDYIALCREVGAEPVVVVAADYYLIDHEEWERVTPREVLIEHAAAWVYYANIRKGYGVKYWMIGNERWNNNNKNSNVEIYARDVTDFSKAMKKVDPSILIFPNGDSDEFFKTVISQTGSYIDGICVSNYGVWNFKRGYDSYRDSAQCLVWPALYAIEAMNKYATPEQLKSWKVIVAEYGTIDWAGYWKGENDMGHALVTFDMTGQLLELPQVAFSCYWNTRWIENETKTPDHDVLDKDGNILPTGKALSVWTHFMADKMIKTESDSSLVSYSTCTPENGEVFLYIINKDEHSKTVKIVPDGYKISGRIKAWEYFGKSPEDKSPLWQKMERVKRTDKLKIKGYSISVFSLVIEPES